MIKINNDKFKIEKIIDENTAGVRHLTLVVYGDVRKFDEMEVELLVRGHLFTGLVMLPHYCKDNNTTMFLVYISE